MDIGGQSLVGVYAMLLYGRKGFHCYLPETNSNNKITKGKRLISKNSGVSLTALDTHLQKLVDLGLCSHMPNGGFILLGQQKIKHKFNSYKNVPIRIGKNLRETKGNVNAVLITANIYRQVKQIDKKVTLNKALCQERKGLPLDASQARAILRAHRNERVDLDNLYKVENTVLSNQGFSNVIRGRERGDNYNSVSHGGYWRKVLQERGFVFSRRRYRTIWSQKISYTEFLSMKKWFNEQYGFVSYRKGRVVKPIVSEVFLPYTDIIDNTIYNSKYIISNYTRVEGTPLDIVNQNENRL